MEPRRNAIQTRDRQGGKPQLLTVGLHLGHGLTGLALAARGTSCLLDAGAGGFGLCGSGLGGSSRSHCGVLRFEMYIGTVQLGGI
jgi:hypothetical protein